jgi:hypothetical protein
MPKKQIYWRRKIAVTTLDIISKIFTVIGNIVFVLATLIAFREYRANQRHKALSNAILLVEKFYQALEGSDIEVFKQVIVARGESAGGDSNGHFCDEDGQLHDFGVYFSEGSPDNGAMDRIIHNLDRTCFFAMQGQVDNDYIFAELGQFIAISYEILDVIPYIEPGENILSLFRNVKIFHEMYKSNTRDIPVRIIGYIE